MKMKTFLVSGSLLVLLAASAPALQLQPRPGPETRDLPNRGTSRWYQGAKGYEQAKAEAEAKNLPLAVYFYTDWCPHCRNFQSNLLDAASVDAYLGGIVKVRINPEKNGAELAKQYGISGYPTFFLQARAGDKPERLSPWMQDRQGSRLRTPGEFIAACKERVGGGGAEVATGSTAR
jgi:thiol:disulfide interchange protein